MVTSLGFGCQTQTRAGPCCVWGTPATCTRTPNPQPLTCAPPQNHTSAIGSRKKAAASSSEEAPAGGGVRDFFPSRKPVAAPEDGAASMEVSEEHSLPECSPNRRSPRLAAASAAPARPAVGARATAVVAAPLRGAPTPRRVKQTLAAETRAKSFLERGTTAAATNFRGTGRASARPAPQQRAVAAPRPKDPPVSLAALNCGVNQLTAFQRVLPYAIQMSKVILFSPLALWMTRSEFLHCVTASQ